MAKNPLLIIDSTQPTLRMALWQAPLCHPELDSGSHDNRTEILNQVQDDSFLMTIGKTPYDASSQFFMYMDEIIPNDTELNAVVGLTGPGSFTSLRTGLSALHGIALARDIPAIGISSFEAYAKSRQFSEKTLILIESQREDHYAQYCDETGLIGKPFLCTLEDANKEEAVIGNTVNAEDLPDLKKVGDYATEILAENRSSDYPLMPLYGVGAHTS